MGLNPAVTHQCLSPEKKLQLQGVIVASVPSLNFELLLMPTSPPFHFPRWAGVGLAEDPRLVCDPCPVLLLPWGLWGRLLAKACWTLFLTQFDR